MTVALPETPEQDALRGGAAKPIKGRNAYKIRRPGKYGGLLDMADHESRQQQYGTQTRQLRVERFASQAHRVFKM
ncbi:MAG: hypothetical protein GC182_04705 [Rhodopseudomonas sp.]|nr:hypothetical protein [Rhodopseudomonas sp.]